MCRCGSCFYRIAIFSANVKDTSLNVPGQKIAGGQRLFCFYGKPQASTTKRANSISAFTVVNFTFERISQTSFMGLHETKLHSGSTKLAVYHIDILSMLSMDQFIRPQFRRINKLVGLSPKRAHRTLIDVNNFLVFFNFSSRK
jgi:hypothetical protein